MKKIISALLTITLLLTTLCLFTACGDEAGTGTDTDGIKVVMKIKGYGKITLALDAENAPNTVEHFVQLCKAHAYDGTYITRMQAYFVLQGGAGCSDDTTIKGEFTSNGVNNQLQHKKGVISMARGNDADSGSNQFFIVLDDSAQTSLDGLYAGFGYVIDGWDVVEAICNDVLADEYYAYYYYYEMGFLPEKSYIKIKSIRVVK